MNYLGVYLYATLMLSNSMCPNKYLTTIFHLPKSPLVYQARCTMKLTEDDVRPQLDIMWKSRQAGDQWSLPATRMALDGLRCATEMKSVTLATVRGVPINALLINGDGDTRRFVYILAISAKVPKSPGLHLLLDQWHEGEVARKYDKQGRLTSITLKYTASHAVDPQAFHGHVFLAKSFVWMPERGVFRPGPFFIDRVSEKKATLADLLVLPGANRLGVSMEYDVRTRTSKYYYKPIGILRDKTPQKLRSASKLEAVVQHCKIGGKERPCVTELHSVSKKQ